MTKLQAIRRAEREGFFDLRADPDGEGTMFQGLDAAVSCAERRAERTGAGPYLIYAVIPDGSGEREIFVGEVG